jgi:DNA primase
MTTDIASIRDRHPLVDVVARYTEVVRKGSEYVSLCLFHNDAKPSMTIFRGRDGVQRFRCFACGATGDVVDFIKDVDNVDTGEAIRRLDGEQLPMPNTRTPRELPPDESEVWVPIVPVPEGAPKYDPGKTWNPKRAAWVRYRPALSVPYYRPDGGLVGHIVRLEFEDGQKICPVITYCEGPGGERRWCAKRPKPPYPLVGCEQLARRPKDAVMVVEGEKKRIAGEQVLPAFIWLSLLGGAEAVAVNDLTPLEGRHITLWPDADPVGRKAMRMVAEKLS